MQANIFDIQKYCIHDGPGIRTTIFFKGCTLRCDWCCNPESQFAAVQLGYYLRRCIGCGNCGVACPQHRIVRDERGIHIDRDFCGNCNEKFCVQACPAKALVAYGRRVTMDSLLSEVEKDAVFYAHSGGGVTASGGEPLAQPEFLAEFFYTCRECGYNTAVETSSHVEWEAFESVIPYTDLFLCDLKHIDPELFTKRTGGRLNLVLENLQRLRKNTDQIIVRIPLIPGFNDDTKTMDAMSRFIRELKLTQVHLLPYHRLGKTKYESLGRLYPLDDITINSKEKLEELQRIPIALGLQVQIGG